MNTRLTHAARRFVGIAALVTLGACASMGATTQTVNLSGDEETPPIATVGNGTGTFVVAADGTVSGAMTAYNFTPTVGHIHMAAKGVAGPVIVPMTKTGQTFTVPAGSKLTPDQLAAYKAGNLYANIHSAAHPAGEIRAQLKPL